MRPFLLGQLVAAGGLAAGVLCALDYRPSTGASSNSRKEPAAETAGATNPARRALNGYLFLSRGGFRRQGAQREFVRRRRKSSGAGTAQAGADPGVQIGR